MIIKSMRIVSLKQHENYVVHYTEEFRLLSCNRVKGQALKSRSNLAHYGSVPVTRLSTVVKKIHVSDICFGQFYVIHTARKKETH